MSSSTGRSRRGTGSIDLVLVIWLFKRLPTGDTTFFWAADT
jgi:hypothetical protein